MKRTIFYAIAGLALLLVMGGCRKNQFRSLLEMKRDQQKAIERLITTENLKVRKLSDVVLPAQPDPNVYYLFPNGIYMRVIDAGTGKAEAGKTHVFLKLEGKLFKEDQTINEFNSIANPKYQPTEFLFINQYYMGERYFNLIGSGIPSSSLDYLMCEGLAFPMAHLGDGARVSLIIPFTMGSETYYKEGLPMYVKEAIYNFKK